MIERHINAPIIRRSTERTISLHLFCDRQAFFHYVNSMKVEVRKWKDAVYWMAAEVRMLMERAEIEGLELGAGAIPNH